MAGEIGLRGAGPIESLLKPNRVHDYRHRNCVIDIVLQG